MKMRKFSTLAVLAVVLLLPALSYSQWIINDKDGWTNIRKKPNAKSDVVGKVLKHQVFHSTINCGYDEPPSNWEAVTVGSDGKSIEGYIFKNNITRVDSFPLIVKGRDDREDYGKSRVITEKKDSITVTMKIVQEKPGSDFARGAEEIIVIINGKKIVIPPNIYYARAFSLFFGNDGALYLLIENYSDGESQKGWYSIVNGKVVFSTSWYMSC